MLVRYSAYNTELLPSDKPNGEILEKIASKWGETESNPGEFT